MNRIIDNEFNIPTDEKYPEELNCYAEKPYRMTSLTLNTHRAGKKRNQTDQSR